MQESRRKELCELLQIVEYDLLVELLKTYRDKKVAEFWTAVDQLKSFVELKQKVCRE